jgi:hypothetical protein
MIPLERVAGAAPVLAPVLVLSIAAVVGASVGLGPALLVIAAGMLVAAIAGLWSSLGRLTGESPLTLEEAVGLGAPSPEEERKRSILRALKDLEYERSVGKISDADFAELTQRYRAEAKTLLQMIAAEDAPRRKKAEAQLAARLKEEGLAAAAKKHKARASRSPAPDGAKTDGAKTEDPGPPDEETVVAAEAAAVVAAVEPADAVSPPPPPSTEKIACASCDTKNDPDSSFCKRCGAELNAGEAS